MPAHRFGVLGEATREIGSLRGHERTPRRRGPAVAGGPEGGALLLCYSAETACGSVATGPSSAAALDSAMAVSPPIGADSSPPVATGEPASISGAGDAVMIARPGVRSGSGSQPEQASSSCALSAISPFFR